MGYWFQHTYDGILFWLSNIFPVICRRKSRLLSIFCIVLSVQAATFNLDKKLGKVCYTYCFDFCYLRWISETPVCLAPFFTSPYLRSICRWFWSTLMDNTLWNLWRFLSAKIAATIQDRGRFALAARLSSHPVFAHHVVLLSAGRKTAALVA